MPCYSPLTGYYSRDVGASGKRGITFQRSASFSGVPMKLPCGQCIGCRLERSRQWAIRCVHETKLHEHNEFVTLTYDNEHLPAGGTLVKRDLQLFMKRLRKMCGNGIRFYACGEYGETTGRPHYHLLLFNCTFPDKVFYKRAKRGENLYKSAMLYKLWPLGHNVIGAVTFDSAAYVARYLIGKHLGDPTESRLGDRLPEFTLMSRRPGIGAGWFEKYMREAYADDSVIMNGKRIRPPRYYDTKFELVDSKRLAKLKQKRRRKALVRRADNSPERRRVRARIQLYRLKHQTREV